MSKETVNKAENDNEVTKAVKKATQIITDKEARTCTFTKNYRVHGKNKTGTFVFKYPSLMDRTQIGIARAKMLDGASEKSLDQVTSDLSYMIAYIGHLCIKQPAWFNLGIIEEYEIIEDLFTEVTKWVRSFRRELETSEDAGHSDSANDEDAMEGDEAV